MMAPCDDGIEDTCCRSKLFVGQPDRLMLRRGYTGACCPYSVYDYDGMISPGTTATMWGHRSANDMMNLDNRITDDDQVVMCVVFNPGLHSWDYNWKGRRW